MQVQVTPFIYIRDVPYADFIQLIVYRDITNEFSLTDATNLGRLPWAKIYIVACWYTLATYCSLFSN